MKEGRLRWIAAGTVLVVGGAFVFWHARWYVFQTRISNVLQGLPAKPTVAQITGVPARVRGEASALWISPDSLALEVVLEQHRSLGFAMKEDMTEAYWFVEVHARRGGSSADWEKRIDQPLDEATLGQIESAGLVVKRPPKPGGS